MQPQLIFLIHLALGYVAWGLCFAAYIWPWLRGMDGLVAQRAIATFHSFRFFGLVFILPGVVGLHLPAGFAPFAAYGDFATGVLAILALFAIRSRPLFWALVVGYNAVGVTDLVVDYYQAIQTGVPFAPGELGAAYAIPIIYVPLLMITHIAALRLLVRSAERSAAV